MLEYEIIPKHLNSKETELRCLEGQQESII